METMAEDQSMITNHSFDPPEAKIDECSLDPAKTWNPRPASLDQSLMFIEAWEHLRRSVVCYKGQAVGTIAALDNASVALNYDQVL